MILVKNLFLRFVREYYALHDISLKIENGEKVAFVGAKGSGKTTLIRVLARLEEPTSGEVYVNDIAISKVNYKTDLEVGYIPVIPIHLKKKTVYENFEYILKQRKISKEESQSKIMQVLKSYNLEKVKDLTFEKLSLYQQYLVSFARLSLRKIELLLVDNIFEKLSEEQVEKLIKVIKENFLNQTELTSVVATSSSVIAQELATKNLYFKFGSHVEQKPEDVM